MAGSLGHCLNGWSLIENMGDAHEAVEQLLWLILEEIGEHKAEALLKGVFWKMYHGEIPKSEAYLKVEKLMSE